MKYMRLEDFVCFYLGRKKWTLLRQINSGNGFPEQWIIDNINTNGMDVRRSSLYFLISGKNWNFSWAITTALVNFSFSTLATRT